MRRQPDTARQPQTGQVILAEKLAFLRQPAVYPELTRQVETRETHMSWVFLTDGFAYKLKKPVSHPFLDYSTLEMRRQMCGEEIRLNLRLADWVYLGVASVILDENSRLTLADPGLQADGMVIEWLVKMVRLPAASMLDQAILDNTVSEASVERVACHLSAFYRHAAPIAMPSDAFIAKLRQTIEESAHDVAAAGAARAPFAATVRTLLAFLDERGSIPTARVACGRIVEGHGDLRPEHVYLGTSPAIIDCLEFSRDFRLVDPLEELAFLAMECTRLGAARWGERFLEVYLRETGDSAAGALVRFYMAARACLRAKLALGHLRNGDTCDPQKWRNHADDYIALANRFAAGL
jgi:uncharacterized protein